LSFDELHVDAHAVAAALHAPSRTVFTSIALPL
jgi:hypothetical protein